MHILVGDAKLHQVCDTDSAFQVINDDGPPSCQSSPYVHAFVVALQAQDHTVSVVLPHVQRSWIGKAHFVHQLVTPSYFRPGTVHEDDGTTHELPLESLADGDSSASNDNIEEWVLVDGTPATCAQMGLFHFYQDRGPVDVVVSGPNFGRNSTALFGLSSGTIGGAMEAAVCGAKAIAVSFAFSPEGRYLREPIEAACRLSVKLVEYLVANWDEGVELYNVNVPLLRDVEGRKILWTTMLENKWRGSSFKEVREDEKNQSETRDEKEKEVRETAEAEAGGKSTGGKTSGADQTVVKHSRHEHRTFKWFPSFKDVHQTVKESKEGNDGLAIFQDCIRYEDNKLPVLFEKALQMHADHDSQCYAFEGKLHASDQPVWRTEAVSDRIYPSERGLPEGFEKVAIAGPATFTTYVKYEDAYVQPLIKRALGKLNGIIDSSTRPFASRGSPSSFLQITPYEAIEHDLLLQESTGFMANSYTIRKALIRKEYLASIIRHWSAKNPDALLSKSFPETISLHLDYAEFLDDALTEGDGMMLMPVFEDNAQRPYKERAWWMVKASMADRGQGIRLFSTFEELQGIFELWEEPEDDEEDGIASGLQGDAETSNKLLSDTRQEAEETPDGMTSSLRHFVLQRYIPPFLLAAHANRKFHIRCYVVAVGALKVYVYREMLALFSAQPYSAPSQAAADLDLATHLTNTCLQDGSREGSVSRYWDLSEPEGHKGWLQAQFDAICTATGQLFQAAKASPTDFQPLPNAFELYGVDWLVGYEESVEGTRGELRAWLLEVNAFPDLKQTGDDLKEDIIGGLWDGIMAAAVAPFFKIELKDGTSIEQSGMVLVLDEDMKR